MSPLTCRLLGVLTIVACLSSVAAAQNGPMAATASADGRFEIFVETSHGIEHFWQAAASPISMWNRYAAPYGPAPAFPDDVSPFEPRSIVYRPTIVAGRDGTGRVMAAWIVGGKVYFVAAPSPGASLNEPGALIFGTEGVKSLALAANQDGRLELFTLDATGQVTSYRQQAAGIWAWSGGRRWTPGTLRLRAMSVAAHADGRLALVGVAAGDPVIGMAAGSVVLMEQDGPNAETSSGPTSLFGQEVRSVVVSESLDHRLEVFAHGGDAKVYHKYEQSPGRRDFTEWVVMEEARTPGPVVVGSNRGRMHLVVRHGADQNVPNDRTELIQLFQEERNGAWTTSWQRVMPPSSGPVAYGPLALATTAGGLMGLFEFDILEHRLTFRGIAPDVTTWNTTLNVANVLKP